MIEQWMPLALMILAFGFGGGFAVGFSYGIRRQRQIAEEVAEVALSARRRRLHDAGRTYPARPNSGRPAKVRKLKFRSGDRRRDQL